MLTKVGGTLRCGGRCLEELADEHGTPLFVYDGGRALARLATLRAAFAPLEPLVAYSVKANPNLALLRAMAGAGAGADIVSGGELYRSLQAGVRSARIVFAGVGKTREEMRMGIEAGIKSFHVESEQEMQALAEVAKGLGSASDDGAGPAVPGAPLGPDPAVAAPMGVRVNPDVSSPTHDYTRTGHAAAKFGVPPQQAVGLFRRACASPFLRPVGVAVHLGSQIRDPAPFLRALDVVLDVVDRVRRDIGLRLRYVDLGGGFGIADGEAGELDVATLGRDVAMRLRARDLELVLEPGRFLVGDAGVLVTRALYVKRAGGKTFVVTDAGMTELIRPSHYGGVHAVSPVRDDGHGAVERVDVVGPVCEQGDFLARDCRLPLPSPGALLCVQQAGAYGFAMASNYNSRRRPAEVLVLDGEARVVRRRERWEDLVRGEASEPAQPWPDVLRRARRSLEDLARGEAAHA